MGRLVPVSSAFHGEIPAMGRRYVASAWTMCLFIELINGIISVQYRFLVIRCRDCARIEADEMPAMTMGQVLAKKYFADMADEWHDRASQTVISILQEKRRLAHGRTDAVVLSVAASTRELVPEAAFHKFQAQVEAYATKFNSPPRVSTNSDNLNKSASTSLLQATTPQHQPQQRVEIYTPSGVVLITAPTGNRKSYIPQRYSSRQAKFTFEATSSVYERAEVDHRNGSMAESRYGLMH
jgi:hypothetical protein